eukprot:7851541-Pyramimonas_sp.AAC.1
MAALSVLSSSPACRPIRSSLEQLFCPAAGDQNNVMEGCSSGLGPTAAMVSPQVGRVPLQEEHSKIVRA